MSGNINDQRRESYVDDGMWGSAQKMDPVGWVWIPSDSVVLEKSYGQNGSAGSSSEYARGDHTHGTPPLPTPSQIGAVPAVAGMGLSKNDYTDAEKAKLAWIAAGAQANTVDSVNWMGWAVSLDTSKIPDTADKRYLTEAERAKISATSWTNTGDETTSTILTKIGDGSKISPAYLPSYVDDVIEAADFASLPVTGEAGKIYVTIDTGYQYRWSGSVYVEIKDSGETSASMGVLINSSWDATPNDTDFVATALSGGLMKKISWTNAKAFMKTYFDTLYASVSSLSSYVPTSRSLTINWTSYDLSADRSWTIASSSENLKRAFVAGESVTAGNALTILSKSAANFSSSTDVSTTANNKRVALEFRWSGVGSNSFSIVAKKTWTPAADLNFRIETDSSGRPSWTLADANATWALTAAAVTTSLAEYSVTMPASVTLAEGTKYHLVIFCGTYGSETVSNVNYFSIGHKSGFEKYQIYDTSAWMPYTASGVTNSNDFTDPAEARSTTTQVAWCKFTATKNMFLTGFTRAALATDTTWYVLNSAKTQIATGAYSGWVATLSSPIFIPSGTSFYLTGNSGGTNRQQRVNRSPGLPITLTDLNVVWGITGTTDDGWTWGIGAVATQAALDTGAYSDKTFYLKSPIVLWTVYKAEADVTEKAGFLWFAESSVSEGGEVTVIAEGFYDGLSGLVQWVRQYVSNTAWALSDSPWTYPVSIGLAVSPTCVSIGVTESSSSSISFTRNMTTEGTSTHFHWLWVIPKSIEFHAATNYAGNFFMWGSWTAKWQNCVQNQWNGLSATNAVKIYWVSWVVQNVTSTTFDIVWTGTLAFNAYVVATARS